MGEKLHKQNKREMLRKRRQKHLVGAVAVTALFGAAMHILHIEMAAKGVEWTGAAIVYWVLFGSIEA